MEEGDLQLNPSESGEQQPQVLYVSGNTYYTTAEGEGQEPMVTYMYGDEQSAETQYMMIQGADGEDVLQEAGDHYMMTSDTGVRYVLVSDDMATSAQPQFVLDQSAMEGQMSIMQNVLNDQMVSGVGMPSTEAIQLSEMPTEVDFLNSVDPVAANPAEMTSEADFGHDLGSAGQDQLETGLEAGVIGEATKMEVEESENLVPETEHTEAEPTAGLEEPQPDKKVSFEVKHVAEEPTEAPPTVIPEKEKPRLVENITKAIHVTSVPIPSSSKDSKPIITVKPSPVSHLDGDRIKIETSGGVQKVFILPMSPQGKGTGTSSSSSTTLPIRFISQEQMSSYPVQTITLPLKSNALAGNTPKQIRPAVTVSTGPRTTANILAPNIIKRGVGRPPLKDRLKPSPQMQSAGPVKIRPASSQVIVIPIQVSKDSLSSGQINGAASTKVTPSGSGAPRVKAMSSASEKALKGVKKGGIMKTKVMPKFTKKQAAKLLDEDETPSSTRRSKRQNNMSMKLAEWGLLPTGGRSSSSSEDELEDELDFDDEDDEEQDDDNDSNSSISLGIYAKSAQKGARKLGPIDDKRFSTPQVAKVSMGSKAPVRVLPGSAPAKRTLPSGALVPPQAPKEMQNKSLMCKPIMMTKATSCNPIRLTKETQTEKDEGDIVKIPIPVPIPLFVPAPVSMGTKPVPVPVPFPVPVPIPALMPITKNSISNILKQLKNIRETLPAEEDDVLKVADGVSDSAQEAEAGAGDGKAVVKQEAVGEEVMSNYLQQLPPLEVVEMAMHIASQIPDDPSDEAMLDGTAGESMELDANTLDSVDNLAGVKKRYTLDESSRLSKRTCAEVEPVKATLRQVPVNDSRMKLKYSYGLNAWWHWVTQRNAQMELSLGAQGRFKPFKVEILQCCAEELSHCLSLFIREVRKPSGEEYAPDSIFYLCLGIQHYLYENNRIDSLFHDVYYNKFSDTLNDLLAGFEVRLNAHGQIVCRVTEEHLWESRQLGVHSPHILLNTLVYFNTKHFMLNTTEGHLSLSFSNIMKQWKKNTMTADGRAARTVYLRYNATGPVVTPTTNAAEAQRRKSLETMPYEQLENPENPLRCPVKLYEFYLSKCPESIKHRNDMFYLIPEPSCVPDSPVWYSTTTLGAEAISKMLNRIRVVREVQESQINQIPTYYS